MELNLQMNVWEESVIYSLVMNVFCVSVFTLVALPVLPTLS
jgi:hypothetical protein